MPRMYVSLGFLGAVLLALLVNTDAFSSSLPNPFVHTSAPSNSNTALCGGVGVADKYSWNEEQFEIELKITVPARTSADDIKFKCSSVSIDLRLLNGAEEDNGSENEKVLLDGSRQMRGKICVDGTFWSIEGDADEEREIIITIEKHIVPISSAGGTQTYDTLTDFDWGGIYPNDKEEVSHRKYDEAEELNVREYAAKLGVDIDNIDMKMVNKTMFGAGLGNDGRAASAGSSDHEEDGRENDGNDGSGNKSQGYHLNITQATLDQLTKVGLAKEIVKQGDGMEYDLGTDGTLNEENVFSMLGKDISNDELREAGIVSGGNDVPTKWQTVPVEEAPGYQKTYDAGNSLAGADVGIIENEIVEREVSSSGYDSAADVAGSLEEKMYSEDMDDTRDANDESMPNFENVTEERASTDTEKSIDPIDMLTVARLKEILRAQGLRVSGKKQVLRDRLRSHVSALLQEE